MKNRCINCKREIAPHQQECFICGASQSYLRYHMKSGIVFLLLLSGLALFSYWYIDKSTKEIELNKTQLTQSKNEQAVKQIQQIELQLKTTNEKLLQAEASAIQAIEVANQEKLKFDEAEKRAIKAEERASWLSKENRRFKAKVKELNDKITATKPNPVKNKPQPQPQPQPQPLSETSSIESLKQQLIQYENQKQRLINSISLTKKQLEKDWLQASNNDSTPPTEKIVAQRAQQLTQATLDEQNKIQILNNQIEATQKKIDDIEAAGT